MDELQVEKSVNGLSGRRIGSIAEVRPKAFLVRTDSREMWLRRDCVFTVDDDGRVMLICEEANIGRYESPQGELAAQP